MKQAPSLFRHGQLAAFAMLALAACGPVTNPAGRGDADAYSQLHEDSGIPRGKFATIVDQFKALQTQYAALTEIVEYGTSGRGAKLMLMRIQDKTVTVTGKRPAALLSEGIHGNEYLNIADRIPKELLTSQPAGFKAFLAKGGVIYVLPILNPDGYDGRTRENSAGTDLNRSFPIKGANYAGIPATETQAIRDYVAKEVATGLSLELVVENHCCLGALITPWAWTHTKPAQDVQDRAKQITALMSQHIGVSKAGTVHEILNYPPTNGGSDDYYLETYGRRAYSYEGRAGSEQNHLAGHVKWWDSMFDLVAKDFQPGTGGTVPTQPTQPTQPATGELFLAVEKEPAAGSLSLLASTPDGYEGVELCLGTKADCTGTVPPKKIATTFSTAAGGRRIYKANEAVAVQESRPTALTILGMKGGKAEIVRQVNLQKK